MSSFEADALIETALYAVSPLDRDAARTELIRRPTHQQTKWLIALLDAPSKLVRRRAVRLLGDINPSHIRPFIQTIFSEVDSSSRVVVALARMLSAQTKDAEPLLSIGLESPDPKVRLACATRAAPEAALINGLLDESVEVRNKCAHCLNEREKTIDPDVLTRLVTLIGPKEEQCLILIARANPEHPILADMSHMGMRYLDFARNPIQIERHEHSSPIQKSWALSRLRSLPTEAALHPNPEIRAAFARACMSDAAALDRLCEDQDPVVRWMARRAKSGAFDPTTIEQRLAPHSRLDAPSAKPPYGIKPGDEKIGTQRIKAALALCHGRIDVNIGVAVRSAEAAGFSEVFVVGGQPLMRSAMRGTDLVMNVEQVPDGAALMSLARERGYQLVAVQQTPCSQPYHQADYPPQPLFMMGAEDIGLPASLRAGADLAVEIPMFGEIDSLNVATAATTVMFHWRIHHAR